MAAQPATEIFARSSDSNHGGVQPRLQALSTPARPRHAARTRASLPVAVASDSAAILLVAIGQPPVLPHGYLLRALDRKMPEVPLEDAPYPEEECECW